MRKSTVLATIAAMGITGSISLPAQAADTNNIYEQLNTKGYAVLGGQINNPEDLKNILSDINDKLCDFGFNINDCPVITPPTEDVPETDQPDSDQPGTDIPDTDIPSGDTNKPDNDTNKPGTDHNKPDTDTDKPDTDSGNGESAPQERTFAEQVVDLVNAERAKAGLGSLTLDKGIEKAALVRANEIETSFSHTRPDGRSFSTVLTDNGIRFSGSGENIAWGQATPQDVMNAWMNSDGHRANILNAKFTKIGVGYRQNSAGRNYWTQLFTY